MLDADPDADAAGDHGVLRRRRAVVADPDRRAASAEVSPIVRQV
jgi:hypothetical protein